MQERKVRSENGFDDSRPKDISSNEWFKIACDKASQGKQKEAEVAVRRSLSIRHEYPIAWVILSAILLAQGRETDAEQAGKKAISQCKGLKMTWPKMRSIIHSHGVIRGASWKDTRRVVIEASNSSEWGKLLGTLGKSSEQDIEEIASSREILDDDKEEVQIKIDTPKQRTPTKTTDVSAKKYESASKRFQGHEDDRVELELTSESMKEYTPTRTVGVTEKKKYESAAKMYQSHEDRRDEQELQTESMKEYTPRRTIGVTEKKKYESAEKMYQSHEDRRDEQELQTESMKE